MGHQRLAKIRQAMSARGDAGAEAPKSRAPECGCFDTTVGPTTSSMRVETKQLLGEMRRTPSYGQWERSEQSLSHLEEGKSEGDGAQLRSGPLLGSAASGRGHGDQKGNSRFVHACTNHVQRKDDTGRATWAHISLGVTVRHARLSPPTRKRGSWHPNQSKGRKRGERVCGEGLELKGRGREWATAE